MKVLEKRQVFSKSVLWDYQRRYFDSKGVSAWLGGVPYYVTSNTLIGRGYAEVVFRYWQDLSRLGQWDDAQPLYLFELGSGAGRFSYHFLVRFAELLDRFGIEQSPLRYVMTDFTQANLEFWIVNQQFKPFLGRGLLDFAIYQVGHSQEIRTYHHQETIKEGFLHNPTLVVANYLFDTVEHDAFRMEEGKLHQALISVKTPEENIDKIGQPKELKGLETSFDFDPIELPYYDDPALNKVLEDYRAHLKESTFLMPIGGIECLNHLLSFSKKNQLFLISGDKGYTHLETLEGLRTPHIAFHGSFSMMVNFDAIARYCRAKGGDAWVGSDTEGFKISVFAFNHSLESFAETEVAFESHLHYFSTKEFLPTKNRLIERADTLDALDLLALLKLSYWDPDILFAVGDKWSEKLSGINRSFLKEFREGLQTCYRNYYRMPTFKRPLVTIGQLYACISDYEDALKLFDDALGEYGPSANIYVSKGMCHYYLGDSQAAKVELEKALQIEPNHSQAKEWLSFVSD